MNLTANYKNKVVEALKSQREQLALSDARLARRYGISASVFSRIMNGEIERVLDEGKWITIGRELNVSMGERNWKAAKTDVFKMIEEQVLFCKEHSKARMFVDECEIGKTFTAKYLSRTLQNCFYIDVSQCKTRNLFVRTLAKAIGLDSTGMINELKEDIKYYISVVDRPVIILDEFGDASNGLFLELKEFWNATENICGWYMMGAEGLRYRIERNIKYGMIGFKEIRSRFSTKMGSIVPVNMEEKKMFYKKLVTDVIAANAGDKSMVSAIVNKCLVQIDGQFGGLRRAESLLILHSEK